MNIASTPKERLYFLVANYFKFFADISLKRWRPQVVAITGSTGKTTLLELLDFQLGNTAHLSHNANSIYGIAFDILGLRGVSGSRLEWLKLFILAPLRAFSFTRQEAIYIVEIDAGRPNGARVIANWLRPSITALTGIEQSHAEFYEAAVKSGKYRTFIEAISDEFMSIPRATSELLIIPEGVDTIDRAIEQNLEFLPRRVLKLEEKSTLKSYEVSTEATKFTLSANRFSFSCPLPKEVWLQLAMMQSIVSELGFNELKSDMTDLAFPPGRSSVLAGIKDSTLIDSSYNAQLSSMLAILKMYKSIATKPKWLVIGDIIELGSREADQHVELAKFLLDYPVDRLVLVGRRCQKYMKSTLSDKRNVLFANDAHVALDFLQTNIHGGETILFKGSQHLEWIIAKLLANPASDMAKLPRQSPAEKTRLERLGYK